MGESAESERLEAELTAVFKTHRAALTAWVERAFPRLAGQADDLVQEALLETLRRVRDEGFSSQVDWRQWLRVVTRSRALDCLRNWERRVFRHLASTGGRDDTGQALQDSSANPLAVDREPDPQSDLTRRERRGRQGLLLSQVLQQFCRWCEARPERAAVKEAYERSLRGQQPAEIAEAMGISPARVYEHLNRARSWLFDRIRQADVDRSVFLTLHRCKPE